MCRCVYTGEVGLRLGEAGSQPAAQSQRSARIVEPAGGTRRSQRKAQGPAGIVAPRRPLLCRAADGTIVPMHTCDIAFITYELLRKELGLGANERCPTTPSKPAPHC